MVIKRVSLKQSCICDKKEYDMISKSIYGGRSLPRIHYYVSADASKDYNFIFDCLNMFDISGMYVYIMRKFEFPYDKSRYATLKELETFNILIKNKQYDDLLKVLPKFNIAECDCQPNEMDLEPSIGRHENKRLIWDCKRRTDCYTSIDINLLLKNRGHLFEIKNVNMG